MKEIDRTEQSKAIASAVRMTILDWLKEPARHFADQQSADPAEVGVCVSLLAAKLATSQPTASRHLDVLRRAGFVRVEHRNRWSYYSRDEEALAEYRDWLERAL